ncbi:MAG TPA: mercury methylation corrinoid protein HgcA [Bacteroidales bacterium]|nr:mercury methylation corrinoid protein HgcA [Bacteroidales bacterium]HPS72919.1 mercury methylation corrinoid protein HgcA [Bacteroidales bacterium]
MVKISKKPACDCGCNGDGASPSEKKHPGLQPDFIIGSYPSGEKSVPLVSTTWSRTDRLSALKVRWSIGRMHYKVDPGIYAVGKPGDQSLVFVTANYKLSFDHLRRGLDGLDAWILVLDTKGINVWCAAGKGTFGTKELVRRIRIHHLADLVTHRRIILPQLSATGVAAHEVKKMTGFSVTYGPVRAVDIKAFLDSGLKAGERMRTVTFSLADRLKLIPVDIFYAKYYLLLIPALFFLLSGLNPHGYSIEMAVETGSRSILNLFAGYLSGCALTPILLPWIPFRRFSLKGLLVGWLVALFLMGAGTLGNNAVEIGSWFLIMGGLSSFMAMNFTGSSTFTSLSGVQKEMKTAIPVQITMTALGLAGWIFTRFIIL